MAGWRRVVELAMTCEETRSRTEPASGVSRAQMLLAYRENPSSHRVLATASVIASYCGCRVRADCAPVERKLPL
jgi:hypothetical protein